MKSEDYNQKLLLIFFIKKHLVTLNEEFIEFKVYFAIYLCACWTHTIIFSIEKRFTMEIKLARNEINGKPKTITLDKITEIIEKEGQKIFYFDKENSHKDLVALVEHFEVKGFSVYLRDIHYGLGEGDYMYEVHIL